MSDNTTIEWATHTWNPWEGCTQVSPGCAHCYAEARNRRFSKGANWGKGKPRHRTSMANWRKPALWNRDAEKQKRNDIGPFREMRPRVFPSLCDWLDDEVPIEWLADFIKLMADTPHLDWQLLSKRPQNFFTRLGLVIHWLYAESDERKHSDKRGQSRGNGDRQRGAGLAIDEAGGRQVERRHKNPELREGEGGNAKQAGLPSSARDVESSKNLRIGASAGVAALPRTDSERGDNKSQKRGALGQQTGKPRTGELSRSAVTRTERSTSQEALSEGIDTSENQGRRQGCSGDAPAAALRDDGEGHRDNLSHEAQSGELHHDRADLEAFAGWLKCWCNGEPPANIWIGTSVEDQLRADERIPELLKIPAAVRFLSVEPLMGPVSLLGLQTQAPYKPGYEPFTIQSIDWVIVGGESGPGARPCNIEWIRDIVRQCKAASVPCFVKQLGSVVISNGMTGPGQHWPDSTVLCPRHEFNHGAEIVWRHNLIHKKGGDPSEWPEDLRVRQFPTFATK
jgi:protein gp37